MRFQQVADCSQTSEPGFPEAVDVAMEEAVAKQWSVNAKTKILVHVADAPSHDRDVNSWNNSSLRFAEMGVRVITVASSGIDKKTEYLFRSQSILTNGIYVYLTNDSGIGTQVSAVSPNHENLKNYP